MAYSRSHKFRVHSCGRREEHRLDGTLDLVFPLQYVSGWKGIFRRHYYINTGDIYDLDLLPVRIDLYRGITTP